MSDAAVVGNGPGSLWTGLEDRELLAKFDAGATLTELMVGRARTTDAIITRLALYDRVAWIGHAWRRVGPAFGPGASQGRISASRSTPRPPFEPAFDQPDYVYLVRALLAYAGDKPERQRISNRLVARVTRMMSEE